MREVIVNQNVLPFPRRKVSGQGYRIQRSDYCQTHIKSCHTATQRGLRTDLCIRCCLGMQE